MKSSVFHKLCGNIKLKPLFFKYRVTLTSRTIWRTKRNVKLKRLGAYSVDENVIVSRIIELVYALTNRFPGTIST